MSWQDKKKRGDNSTDIGLGASSTAPSFCRGMPGDGQSVLTLESRKQRMFFQESKRAAAGVNARLTASRGHSS